jgi:uncharacterized protein (DUF1697 family)
MRVASSVFDGGAAMSAYCSTRPVRFPKGERAMEHFIALYRGINVAGKNRVKMESLRAMHERLGHQGVTSYVQSGNIVFLAAGSVEKIVRSVALRFSDEFGFAARVMVAPAALWGEIVRGNPYPEFAAKHPNTVHIGICDGQPDERELRALLARTGKSETFVVKGNVVYLHAPDGFGTSKFAAGMEKASGVPMTVRNWRTVEALSRLVGGTE